MALGLAYVVFITVTGFVTFQEQTFYNLYIVWP